MKSGISDLYNAGISTKEEKNLDKFASVSVKESSIKNYTII